jgi:hypothetical protein
MIKKFIYTLVVVSALTASCKKSFLDEKPYTAVPIDQAIVTVSDLSEAVNGMYRASRVAALFGRDIPIMGDLMADNIYISASNSGRYTVENSFSFTASTAEPANIWNNGYYVISQANRIINSGLASTPQVDNLVGQAYAIRGLVYLQLVNWFAKPYITDASGLGVPVVTSIFNSSNINNKPSRNTVAQVYTQIHADLAKAYTLLTNTAVTSAITKYTAKAIDARAYLYQGDYPNSRDAALDVVTNGGYSLTTSANLNGYWNAASAPTSGKVETMFELELNNATNNGTDALAYMYEQSGYGDMLATNSLYALYSTTDARRSLILTSSPTRGAVLVVNKYQNTSNGADKDNVKMVRYAEVLLTLSESYARLGGAANEVLSLTYLNQLATRRDPSFVGFASTGAQLITDVMNERRKELAFEGFRYFDFTRLNAVITRTTQHPAAVQSIAVGDNKRLLPIPQAEIDANPVLKPQQNPGY